MKRLFSIMSNLQTHSHFKLDFQKVDKHTGGKWLMGHYLIIGQISLVF